MDTFLQDYEPSADQFANMNSAVNWMLLQPADDGIAGASIAFGEKQGRRLPCGFFLSLSLSWQIFGFHQKRTRRWLGLPSSRC